MGQVFGPYSGSNRRRTLHPVGGTLTRTQCLRLLAEGRVGRVVATARALPIVRPVNYIFDTDGADIVIATDDGELSDAAADNVVAFEIDDVEGVEGTDWSVVVIGLAQRLTDLPALSRARALGLAAFSHADPLMFLRIPASVVMGATRRIVGEAQHRSDSQPAGGVAGSEQPGPGRAEHN
jgi:hypothetical protein